MKKWILTNKKGDVDKLSKALGLSKQFANLLVNRGLDSIECIKSYLDPKLYIKSNFKMKDLEESSEILRRKIIEKKHIRVVGDYDVDGIMSTYILVNTIRDCGGLVDYDIPDRVNDGYGINDRIVLKCLEDGVDTILTCDNGVSAFEPIELAKMNGITVIITDHHELAVEEGEELIPDADCLVNPKQSSCLYPFKSLCGAGIAYKLSEALAVKFMDDYPRKTEILQFAAIATVCDVVDLLDENRYIVKKGLESLHLTENIGLKSLIDENGLGDKKITSYDIGFVIGPCINAAGRLKDAFKALDLFFCNEGSEACRLASELKKLNDERKEQTEEGVVSAYRQVEEYKNDRVLVLYQPDLHESIAGIVAGRIKEKFNLPTIVLAKTESLVKGSGRSVEGYDIFSEMTKYKRLYSKFGGHPMAVGLSMEEHNIEKLRIVLNENFPLSDDDIKPKLRLDLFMPLRFATESFLNELSKMEPFGKGNPVPVFGDKKVVFKGARIVGANKNVLIVDLRDPIGNEFKGIIFKYSDDFDKYMDNKYGKGSMSVLLNNQGNGYAMDIAYQPTINEYQGRRNVQIVIKEYR
ncbi:single-stranded-DNA-specific exonuclease RecJ [Alkalibacter mobilis]|uniref:single-stranded-DNA-specific exonuclease RecJ n=1 Tax=Alkalibacter mobilis TaxID=2787712 RepID=UPI00189FB971|nr:single-stranded-DNA-specific exonuclease RecJ [Alkalibacter mobilis]MBF7095886.1 single-stranded-DNA-specific exonuclease RecJ [Alkalibacter mobilis]